MPDVEFYANENLSEPIATLITYFENVTQTNLVCSTEPAYVIKMNKETQSAESLERTTQQQTMPESDKWGWQSGILYLGSLPSSNELILCYSSGKILFYLDTYTLSGHRQFILNSPFENNRTKIETIYVRLAAGYGVAEINAGLLSKGYVILPDEQLLISDDGYMWSERLLLSNRSNQAAVKRIYAKLTVKQSNKSGAFHSVTIFSRTKGFKSSFSTPSNFTLITSISMDSLSSSANGIVTLFPEHDGTMTVCMAKGALNIDFYNNIIRPAPLKYTRQLTPWQLDAITLAELSYDLQQVGAKFRYKNYPYLFDKFYYFDKANSVIIGNINGSEVTIDLKTNKMSVLPSGSFIGLSNGYMVATNGIYSYPNLQLVKSQTVTSYTPITSSVAKNGYVVFVVDRGDGYSFVYRTRYVPQTNTLESLTTLINRSSVVPNAPGFYISMYPDASFFALDDWDIKIINSDTFSTVSTISGASRSIVAFNIDYSYLLSITKDSQMKIYRVN